MSVAMRILRRAVGTVDATGEEAADVLRGRPWADGLFYRASTFADHSVGWSVLGLAQLLYPQGRRRLLRLWVCLAVESALVNGVLKTAFRRGRPVFDGAHPHHLRTPVTTSFPSGHATSGFLAAALLSEGSRLGPAYHGLAAVVAWSRVHVRIHHASDVAGGVVLGAMAGRLIRRRWPVAVDKGSSSYQ